MGKIAKFLADLFLSTFPLRGTSSMHTSNGSQPQFLSTFPLRGTSILRQILLPVHVLISIHVPLAGNVCAVHTPSARRNNFYPRSPCGERLLAPQLGQYFHLAFLSTFPLRGTSGMGSLFIAAYSISIHVPLAGNVRHRVRPRRYHAYISIHVPLAGNVSWASMATTGHRLFLSTFPLRGTSDLGFGEKRVYRISIHVPLAGNVTEPEDAQHATRQISIHVPLAGNVGPLTPH